MADGGRASRTWQGRDSDGAETVNTAWIMHADVDCAKAVEAVVPGAYPVEAAQFAQGAEAAEAARIVQTPSHDCTGRRASRGRADRAGCGCH